MPIGAENIGTAYVRVVADGKDFDLGDMFEGVEGDADRAGRRLSNAYQEGFKEEMSKTTSVKSIDETIRKSLIKGDAARRFTASPEFYRFKTSVIKEFGAIGERAAQNFDDELSSGRLDISGFNARIENLNRELVKAEKDLNADRRREALNMAQFSIALNKAIAEDQKRTQDEGRMLEAAYLEDRNRMLREAYALNGQFDRQRARQLRASVMGNNELIRTYRALRADIDLMTRGEIEHGLSVTDTAARLKVLTGELKNSSVWNSQVEADINRHHDALLRMNPTLNRYRNSLFLIADATGAAFGRGSRNDFLNFTGSVARNVIRLGGAILNLGGYFVGLKNRMVDAGSFIGGFGVVLGDLRKFATRGALGLAGLFGVIGPLTSVLSGLGGMILAVASTMGGALLGAASSLGSVLAFGVGGGAAIASTAFVPLLAGIGVFTLAVKNADKETKEAFKSIGREFSGLGEAAAEGTFSNIDEQARRFKAVIGDLSPLVRDIGFALSDVGDAWLDMMEGPGFDEFRRAMQDYLPDAVRTLGISIGNLAGGLAGLFRAAIPESQNFLGWIQRITGSFNNFANSANGQTELRAFFARAADSAADLGGFILALTGLLGELFDQANQPGDRLFASMTEGLESWTDALNNNPDIMQGWIRSMENFGDFVGSARDLLQELLAAGQDVGDSLFASMSDTIDGWVRTLRANPDILSGWYDSAADFARILGEVTVGLGKVFDALDNEFSRGVLIGAFEGLAFAIEVVSTALETVADIAATLFGGSSSGILRFTGEIVGATIAVGALNKAFQGTAITGWLGTLSNATTRIGALKSAAKTAAGVGGLLALGDALQDVGDKGVTFGGVLQGAAGGAGIGLMFGPLGALIGAGVGGGLTALAGAFTDTTKAAELTRAQLAKENGFQNAADDAAALSEALVGVVNNYGKVARAAVEASFTGDDGKLDSDIAKLRELGVSMDTIVSAAMGQADAQAIVNDALGNGATAAEQFAADAKAAYEAARDGVVTYKDAQGNTFTQKLPTETIEALEQAWKDAEKAVEDTGVAEDVFEERVRENTGAISDQIMKVGELAKALGLTREQYAKIPQDVRTRFESAGLTQTTQDSLRLIRQYERLQSFTNIKAIISADGAQATLNQIARLARQYDLTPKQVRTLVKTEGIELTKRELRQLLRSIEDVDGKKAVPRIDLDDKEFKVGSGGVRRDLDGIDKKVVRPTIKPDIAPARTQVRILDTDLANVHRKVTQPKVTADTGKAKTDVKALSTDLANLHKQTTNPKVTVDAAAASSTLTGIKNQMDGITSKSVTVTVNYRATGSRNPPTAVGGVFYSPQDRFIAEAGPEAVVPLARNLSQVDPSVRLLSAIAQGKVQLVTGQPAPGPAKTISADGWTIVTPTGDPQAVAREVVDRLAAGGY